MSDWSTDYQLFLYAKGTGPDDVFLRRCKKPLSSSSSSLVVPMKSDDFECKGNVKNYVELIRDEFDWDETDYKRLVKYIYERLLLVNRQGLVIAEIYKLDDVNLLVPIYIRSLDVLRLKPYIPNIVERPIPLRTVKYLEDVNGEAARMEEKDSNEITKLTARVENLEYENKTLDTNVTKLTADLATTTGNVVDLESKNKTLEAENKSLEGKVTKLTTDQVTQMTALTTLQQELKSIYANTKEVWMNDIITGSQWVGVEGLGDVDTYNNLIIVGSPGTFTVDNSYTNVKARYWYKIKITNIKTSYQYNAVSFEDLTPNKEKARFSLGYWYTTKSKGKTFVFWGTPL